jgi:nucleotide-binding universal stress UspA family protein
VPIASKLAGTVDGRVVLVAVGADERARSLQRYLDELALRLGDATVETTVVPGHDAASELAAFVVRRKGALCMTSHGRGGMRWAVLGSVAERVIERSHAATVLVGPRCDPTWTPGAGPVLLCHDGSPLDDAVLDVACGWAGRLGTSILVVTVIHPLDVEDATHADRLFDDVEREIRRRGGRVDHLVVQQHYPAGVLADLAEARGAPLIVMASHARGAVARALLGSTTMGVLNLAACPVVTLAPTVDRDLLP